MQLGASFFTESQVTHLFPTLFLERGHLAQSGSPLFPSRIWFTLVFAKRGANGKPFSLPPRSLDYLWPKSL